MPISITTTIVADTPLAHEATVDAYGLGAPPAPLLVLGGAVNWLWALLIWDADGDGFNDDVSVAGHHRIAPHLGEAAPNAPVGVVAIIDAIPPAVPPAGLPAVRVNMVPHAAFPPQLLPLHLDWLRVEATAEVQFVWAPGPFGIPAPLAIQFRRFRIRFAHTGGAQPYDGMPGAAGGFAQVLPGWADPFHQARMTRPALGFGTK